MPEQLLFYLFALISIASALLAVTRKNPVVSAVFLIVCMFSLAAIYVLLNAFFLAAVQVIVYAGAVLMLFVFASFHVIAPSRSVRSTTPKVELR